MSHLLTDRLHRDTERLPSSLPGPAAVRRSAEAARRRSRAVAVVALAVLALAGGWLVGSGADRSPPAPPAESGAPEPPIELTLDRFLRPADLPASQPFAAWRNVHKSRDMVGSPTCTSMVTGVPQASALVEFTGSAIGVRGYQSVASYPSIDQATAAVNEIGRRVNACPRELDRLSSMVEAEYSSAGDGYQVLHHDGAPGLWELTVHVRAGRLVSVVWLSTQGVTAVDEGTALTLVQAAVRRLAGSPDQVKSDPQVGNPLALAMLRAEDVPGGSAENDDVSDAPIDPSTYTPLHHCDASPGFTDVTRQALFLGANGRAMAGQRVMVAMDVEAAGTVLTRLRQDINRCDEPTDGKHTTVLDRVELALPSVGEEAVGWRYRLDDPGFPDVELAYVVLLRVGTVVTEVVRFGEERPGGDPGPDAAVTLTQTALGRIRAALPIDAAGGQ